MNKLERLSVLLYCRFPLLSSDATGSLYDDEEIGKERNDSESSRFLSSLGLEPFWREAFRFLFMSVRRT